ncbi:MAG: hypothetical protein R3B70_01955 [Polyangiaceae bacterium]
MACPSARSGTALAAVVTGFLGLKAWQMPLVLVGLMLLISGPSLSSATAGSAAATSPCPRPAGWAVNAQAKLNVPFGASLTQIATLPAGASRSMEDPFEEKRTPWLLYLFLLALLGGGVYLWRTGTLGEWWRDLQTPAAAPSAAPSAPAPSST